jgi:hypothetical protein
MWDNNPYYNPENFGLEIVGNFDWCEPDYSFDMLVVWKEKRGQYWIGQDSGCSCPSPFEEITDINQLDGPYNKDGLRKRIDWLIDERTKGAEETLYWYVYPKAQLKKYASDILSRLS